MKSSLSLILALTAVAGLAGCSGVTSSSINVAIASAPSVMFLNDYTTVSATTNDTAGVTWSCAPASSCGGFASSQTTTGVADTYTAPSQIPSGNLVTLTATSVTDTTKSASAQVTISASGIVIAWNTFPSSPLMVTGSESLQVQIQNDSANAGVSLTCAPVNVCGSFSQTTIGAP